MRRIAGILLSIVFSVGSMAAEVPACKRVHDLGFPRPAGLQAAVPLDFTPASPAPHLEMLSETLVLLAEYELDLDGSGRRVPVQVMGYRPYYWGGEFPRQIRRLPSDGEGPPLWSQDIPPGLLGRGRVEDVDQDGRDDLVFEEFTRIWGAYMDSEGFQVFWGDGDRPLVAGWRAKTSGVLARFEDRNGDGWKDAVIRDTFTGSRVESFYPATSPRTWDEGVLSTPIARGVFIDEPMRRLSVGDVDHDGLDDAVELTAYAHTMNLAFARGDGTFDLAPLDQRVFVYQADLVDVDADGNLDIFLWRLPGGPYVSWGHGDRTFDPAVPLAPVAYTTDVRFAAWGDFNGDGQNDLLLGVSSSPLGHVQAMAIPLHGRDAGSPSFFDVDAWYLVARMADLDGDGKDDVVYPLGDPNLPPMLVWRRSLGDGRFGEERQVLPDPLPASLGAFEVTDLDLDGVPDLFVRVRGDDAGPSNMTLRNDGHGTFEVRALVPRTDGYHLDLLRDVDADGRPDLVSFEEVEFLDGFATYPVVLRRGDGLGGFLPPESSWLAFAGETGRFRHAGTVDFLRIGTFGDASKWEDAISYDGDGVLALELLPGTGSVLPADVAPPTVELRSEPGPDGTTRLATLPQDECSSAPRVTGRLVDLLPIGTPMSLAVLRGDTDEVLVYEEPASGRRAVVLRGPDRSRALASFRTALVAGGYPFRHMEPMRLTVEDAWGPSDSSLPARHLVQRFVLKDGVVVEAEIHRPGTSMTFTLTAFDGVRVGVTHASLGAPAPVPAPAASAAKRIASLGESAPIRRR